MESLKGISDVEPGGLRPDGASGRPPIPPTIDSASAGGEPWHWRLLDALVLLSVAALFASIVAAVLGDPRPTLIAVPVALTVQAVQQAGKRQLTRQAAAIRVTFICLAVLVALTGW